MDFFPFCKHNEFKGLQWHPSPLWIHLLWDARQDLDRILQCNYYCYLLSFYKKLLLWDFVCERCQGMYLVLITFWDADGFSWTASCSAFSAFCLSSRRFCLSRSSEIISCCSLRRRFCSAMVLCWARCRCSNRPPRISALWQRGAPLGIRPSRASAKESAAWRRVTCQAWVGGAAFLSVKGSSWGAEVALRTGTWAWSWNVEKEVEFYTGCYFNFSMGVVNNYTGLDIMRLLCELQFFS